MQQKYLFCILGFVLLLVLMFGCSQVNTTESFQTTLTIQAIGTITQAKTVPSHTPVGKAILTESSTIPPNNLITITPTISTTKYISPTAQAIKTQSPLSTLPAEQAYTRLTGLLQNRGDCNLPCWWGIWPGKSTFSDVQNQLFPIAGIADYYSAKNGGGISVAYPIDDLILDFYVNPWADPSDKSIIGMLYISTQMLRYIDKGEGDYEFESVYDSETYNAFLKEYTLSGILSSFGIPSDAIVQANHVVNAPGPKSLRITLLYPEQGIFVRYIMSAEIKDNQVIGCPSKSFVDLWLLAPDEVDYRQRLSLGSNWEGNLDAAKLWEDVTQMPLEQFYETYKIPSETCIKFPAAIWERY
jgi:hypothetical protein